ncbi:hypothetical protein PR048_018202 [Dryococelus australis]|uniref:Uncharacterized protein n=1 Tax=Dryococelus australis TaxID=614101 RepID=A0ABQ9HBN1_9NEOP|nr:hypothetical protein PR048_018202 [Dryococelus australis]
MSWRSFLASKLDHLSRMLSRRTRYARDVAVLLSWLKEHSHWDVDSLQSFASGVVEVDSINCDQAEYVGLDKFSPSLYAGSLCNDLKHYLSYEFSPRPRARFDEVAVRKTVKSAFLQLFSYATPDENSTHNPRRIVIDCGHLLHALVWPCPATYGQIADAYLEFVQKHYRVLVTAVFGGYNVQFTKSQEYFRRIEVRNSEGDADTLIVKRTLELASVRNNATVVASDTDIVVMLLARATDDMEFKVLSPVYNVREIQEKIRESNDSVLFCHAVTDCETSAFLGKCKKKAWKILQIPDMRNVTKVFNSPESMKEEVCAAGEKLVLALYSGINVYSLDELRVIQYTRSIAKQPVTAAFELLTGGWKLPGGFLVPILTSWAPAPESLLRLVSCGSKTNCGYRCECRHAGLAYSTMCGHRKGGSCTNIKIHYFHGSDDEKDPEEATL